MRIIAWLGLLLLLVLAGLSGFFLLGFYDVAATSGHNPLVEWFLETTMESSARRRAAAIDLPVRDEEIVRQGARSYDEMCATCHAAPGVPRSELGEGLVPLPPELAETAGEWTPAELFWITKHGVKMTGMPAWGPTHGDDELLALVAFVQRLPSLDAEAYRQLAGRDDAGTTEPHRGRHEHAH